MSLGDIYLGVGGFLDLLEPMDRKFTIKRQVLSREERTADGTLVSDIIAHKKQFVLSWETIGQVPLNDLIDNLLLDSELTLRVYTTDVLYDTYTVRMQPFDQSRLLLLGSKNGYAIWAGVTVVLDEV